MTTSQPLFTPTADGSAYDIQPAGVLLLLASMVYGPQDDPEWTGGPKTEAIIQAMLVGARGHGYTADGEPVFTLDSIASKLDLSMPEAQDAMDSILASQEAMGLPASLIDPATVHRIH